MRAKADDIAPVGVALEQRAHTRVIERLLGVVAAPVILLVHRLKLRKEQPVDRRGEALGLDPGPQLGAVGGETSAVDGLVVARAGVKVRKARLREDAVKLVGNGPARRLLALAVDLKLEPRAPAGLFDLEELVVKGLDAVEMGLLPGVVERPQPRRALELHVLQIMGHARGLGRVVAGARAHHDLVGDAGLKRVGAEICREAVGEAVDGDAEGIRRQGLFQRLGNETLARHPALAFDRAHRESLTPGGGQVKGRAKSRQPHIVTAPHRELQYSP